MSKAVLAKNGSGDKIAVISGYVVNLDTSESIGCSITQYALDVLRKGYELQNEQDFRRIDVCIDYSNNHIYSAEIVNWD